MFSSFRNIEQHQIESQQRSHVKKAECCKSYQEIINHEMYLEKYRTNYVERENADSEKRIYLQRSVFIQLKARLRKIPRNQPFHPADDTEGGANQASTLIKVI